MKWICSFALSLMLLSSYGQEFEYVYRNQADSSFNSYLIMLPAGAIKGMVVRDYSSLPDANKKSPFRLQTLALKSGYIYLITNTSNQFPELYFDSIPMQVLDEIIHEVVLKYEVPSDGIFIGGISASGTRALRFTQYCSLGKSKYNTQIAGVFACDSPLDMERFYWSSKDILERNHPKGMNEEAIWMQDLFTNYFGGSPSAHFEAYAKASIYISTRSPDSSLAALKDVPIVLFFEADMNWWTLERNANYKDINAIDLVGFARELMLQGNQNVKLVETSGKGFDRQGNRNCHSWTIVDEDLLMEWILKNNIKDR